MNNQISNAKKWPEEKIGIKLKAKRARLIPIDCVEDFNAEADMLRLLRKFQKGEPGRLVGFVGSFLYREKSGERRVLNSVHGKVCHETQIMMVRKLQNWVED